MKQSNLSSFFGGKVTPDNSKAPLATAKDKNIPLDGRKSSLTSAQKADVPPVRLTSPTKDSKSGTSGVSPKLKRLRRANETGKSAPTTSQAVTPPAELKSSKKADQASVPSNTANGAAELVVAAETQVLAQAETDEQVTEPARATGKRRRGETELESSEDTGAISEAQEDAEEGSVPAQKKKKAALKPSVPSQKVEGVGTGSLAAAALHADFDSDKLAAWGDGQPVPFAFLVAAFETIKDESKRLVKTKQLIDVFRAILAKTPQDLLPSVYLCTNQIAPAHAGIELGIGESILVSALSEATGKQIAVIKKEYSETGDLGTVASNARKMQRTMFKPKPLTLQGVFKIFVEIAEAKGQKSQDKKKALIKKLLVSSEGQEPIWIMRALQAKLRIGLGAETVHVALAHAFSLHQKGSSNEGNSLANRLEKASRAVKVAYSQCPSYDKLLPALLQFPVEEVHEHVHFVAGVPIKPMLAKPTTGVSEILDKFQGIEFTCEYKYDGERAQIHVVDGVVTIYSRNLENNTSKYPDLTAMLPGLLKEGVKSVVLDSEAVAFDRTTDKILPFQVLSTRARKDVKVEDIKVKVCIFVFDCLYLNGETLLQKPLPERRIALESALLERPGELHLATAKTSTDLEELEVFLNESVAAGTEGLIIKTLDSTYEPSLRSSHWLKLKKDYLKGVGDTFDVVPIGGWHGKGKRQGVYGSYLLAIYDDENEEYQTISKIGTGFKDEELISLSNALNNHKIPGPKPYYKYGETLVPDVWFDAKCVWEVKAADLSISPVHRAAEGHVDATKGISIRFPRLVRVRDDKGPEDATNAAQVAEMYQQQVLASKNRGELADEEY